jgi:hypothetical protein
LTDIEKLRNVVGGKELSIIDKMDIDNEIGHILKRFFGEVNMVRKSCASINGEPTCK